MIKDLTEYSDENLVQIAQGNTELSINDGFDQLINRYRDRVFGLCFSYLRNRSQAEDVTQEVFIRVCRAIGKFEGRCKFGTWLYRIAANACLNRIRDQKRRPTSLPLEEAILPAPSKPTEDPRHENLKKELIAALVTAVDGLPDRQRETFRLRYFSKLSVKNTAEVMGVEEGTVKAHYFAALKNIRKILEELLGKEKLFYLLG